MAYHITKNSEIKIRMRKEKIKSLNNFSNIKLCWCYHACCCCDDDNDNDDGNEWKDEINMKKMIC